jgi:tetratricopeptide (TPR) repeat protein
MFTVCVEFLLFVALMFSVATNAAPHIPQDANEIIAEWPVIKSAELQQVKIAESSQPDELTRSVDLANVYLAKASQPGQSRLYGLAQAVLKPLIEKNNADKNLWLAWAQVQQHQHNFLIAQEAVEKVLQQDPKNESALLLAARIYVIQENPLAARNSCLKLLGSSDLLTVTACSLEANSYLNPQELSNSYQQLAQMITAQGLPKDERGTWLIQMLADMAIRMSDPAIAAKWLEQRLENASVNYVSQWADVQLVLGQPEKVMFYLTQVVDEAPEADDALLLRLALSEKKINPKDTFWKEQLRERVQLREQRQDTLHANELAIYYLDIDSNPEKALHFAQINFESAREYGDKNLLARAQKISQKKDNQ